MESSRITEILTSSTATVTCFVCGHFLPDSKLLHCYGLSNFKILIGKPQDIQEYLTNNKEKIEYYDLATSFRQDFI